MNELLNLLRTKLYNSEVSKEIIIKLKVYIETGEKFSDLEVIGKCNFIKAFKSHNNMKEDFWKLVDSFMDKEAVFKRIIKVLYAIGDESFFKIVLSRCNTLSKTVSYLKVMEDKEKLLAWFIKNCFGRKNVIDIITVCEEMVSEDKEILKKSFLETKDDFVKLTLASLAIKNSCELPEDGKEFIKQNLKTGNNINECLKDKQTYLMCFFAYACDTYEHLKEAVNSIIHESINKRMLFDELVSFVCFYDKTIESYEVAERFNIDKTIYVHSLIGSYLREENNKVSEEIEERIKEIPLVFKESFKAFNKKKSEQNKVQDVEQLSLAYFIYSYSKEEEDLESFKEAVGKVLNSFINNSKTIENLEEIEKAKIMQYVLEGKNKDLLEVILARVEKSDGYGGHLWQHYGICLQLIYSLDETRAIIHRFIYLLANVGEYRLAALVNLKVMESPEISHLSLAEELLSAGINENQLNLIVNTVSNPKAEKYLNMLSDEEDTELIDILIDSYIF